MDRKDLFPDINLSILEQRARTWATQRYSGIKKISLFRSEVHEVEPQYVLVAEIYPKVPLTQMREIDNDIRSYLEKDLTTYPDTDRGSNFLGEKHQETIQYLKAVKRQIKRIKKIGKTTANSTINNLESYIHLWEQQIPDYKHAIEFLVKYKRSWNDWADSTCLHIKDDLMEVFKKEDPSPQNVTDFLNKWFGYQKTPDDEEPPIHLVDIKTEHVLYDQDEIIPAESLSKIATEKSKGIEFAFLQEGPTWKLTFKGKSYSGLRGSGFEILHYLVCRPKKAINIIDLVKEFDTKTDPDGIEKSQKTYVDDQNDKKRIPKNKRRDSREIIDDQTRNQVKEHYESLQKELKEAEAHNDSGRKERIQEELYSLETYVTKYLKDERLSPRFSDELSVAINRIGKRLTRALKQIEKYDKNAYHHFKAALGNIYTFLLSYNPHKDIPWVTHKK